MSRSEKVTTKFNRPSQCGDMSGKAMRKLEHYNWHQLSLRLRRPKARIEVYFIENVDLLSILPVFSAHDGSERMPSKSLRWYRWWVGQQVQTSRDGLFRSLDGYAAEGGDNCAQKFEELWRRTANYMKTSQEPCIDKLVAQLADDNILSTQNHTQDPFAAREMIFAVIGWQTMLYKIESGTCPPGQLAIVDEMDGYKGQGEVGLKQDQSSCKRRIYQLLMGFGLLLPSHRFTNSESLDEKKAFKLIKRTASVSINAFLLDSICNLTFQWTDSLAYHLELDQASRTLYLYLFPSFCLANIPSFSEKDTGDNLDSVLHACAAPDMDNKLWATRSEITSMLQETILTYRLLFGQSKAARRLFRKLNPFGGMPEEGQDNLLEELCGRKRCDLTLNEERESYDLEHDFPMYRSRLVALHHFLAQSKPHTWKELWQDKRDSAQWFTFWAVLILGGLGLFFAFVQVVLQIVQLGVQ